MIESIGIVGLVILICIPNVKIFLKSDEFDNNYLDFSNTKSLRGFLALLIIVHHFSGYFTSFSCLTFFNHIGYIIVALFFFLSGYGLYYGVKNKSNYLNSFLEKRLSSILLPFWFVNTVYLFVFLIMGEDISAVHYGLSYIGFFSIMQGSWYIWDQLIFYIVFYSVFKILKNSSFIKQFLAFNVVFFTVLVVLYVVTKDDLYIRSSLAFPMGIFWCKYRKNIELFIRKNFVKKIIMVFVVLIVSMFVKFIGEIKGIEIVSLLGNVSSSSVFVIFALFIFQKVSFKNSILNFFGGISLEMFMIHPLFLKLFSKISFIHSHSLLMFILVLMSVILVAFYVNKIDNQMVKRYNQCIRRGKSK